VQTRVCGAQPGHKRSNGLIKAVWRQQGKGVHDCAQKKRGKLERCAVSAADCLGNAANIVTDAGKCANGGDRARRVAEKVQSEANMRRCRDGDGVRALEKRE
jgi:hypothetical protein